MQLKACWVAFVFIFLVVPQGLCGRGARFLHHVDNGDHHDTKLYRSSDGQGTKASGDILSVGSGPNPAGNEEILAVSSGPNPGGNANTLSTISENHQGSNVQSVPTSSGSNIEDVLAIQGIKTKLNTAEHTNLQSSNAKQLPRNIDIGTVSTSVAAKANSGSNRGENTVSGLNPDSLGSPPVDPNPVGALSFGVENNLPSASDQLLLPKLPSGPVPPSGPSPGTNSEVKVAAVKVAPETVAISSAEWTLFNKLPKGPVPPSAPTPGINSISSTLTGYSDKVVLPKLPKNSYQPSDTTPSGRSLPTANVIANENTPAFNVKQELQARSGSSSQEYFADLNFGIAQQATENKTTQGKLLSDATSQFGSWGRVKAKHGHDSGVTLCEVEDVINMCRTHVLVKG